MALDDTKLDAIGRQAVAHTLRRLAKHGIADLPPAYFSLVMATGIVSIASDLLGMPRIALALFYVNIGCFFTLWLLTGLRALIYRDRMLFDLTAHGRSFGYFTLVAGTSVLGVQVFTLTGSSRIALWLWALAGLLWLVVTYAVFIAVITAKHKPGLGAGLSGIWLIAAVATQSVCGLGALIASRFQAQAEILLFLCLVLFLMGCMLYLLIIALIFYRLCFVSLAPQEMTPPYWINMGATAITTHAGATLMLHAGGSMLLTDLLPYLKGFTLFFWAAGTWWIPLLVALAVWTYGIRRVPMTYNPQFWGAVFPMGMYTASTYQLAKALGADFLLVIPKVSVYVALAAWTLAFVGLLRQLTRAAVNRDALPLKVQ